ncbi:hypothetical protein N6H18_05220 [Reichenbachiella agarivorans]|uniref:Maltose/galactoside acetyltransferase domain-containing protein n=1 Tax=Reichenbachiella agarivorans TaxID=2979464 RepID=A0ABY6CS51_9BACT|nr:maltose acetyltransferase domain-containing protein [Reichenbachiella agarivorans]UXP33351.1 hypothetical protein N6H18_05220 [Reichenbachiella agarivorans]
MLAGEHCGVADPQLDQERHAARMIFQPINRTGDENKTETSEISYQLFGKAGKGL